MNLDESKKMDFPKMLRKRKWKGADVGRVALANMAYIYNSAVHDGLGNASSVVSYEKLSEMLNSLSAEEREVYHGYSAIQRWIQATHQMAHAQFQQANFRYTKLSEYITDAFTGENLFRYIEELPYTVTEKQYKDITERRTQEILKPDGKPKTSNVFQLIFNALSYYVKLLYEEPEAENPLKPLKENLELEPVTDSHILDNYNKAERNGYYTLPDGTRSDNIPRDEWIKKINPLMYKFLHKELTEEQKKEISQSRLLREVQIMYEEELDHDKASSKRHEEELEQGVSLKPEFHLYDTPPEDLNKWIMLEHLDIERKYYPHFDVSREKGIEYCKAFKEEFPSVTGTLLEDMGNKYPAMKSLKDLPVEKWLDVSYSWEALYKMDFYDFKNTYVSKDEIFKDIPRATRNGIAIVEPTNSWLPQERIDEQGYYKPPVLWPDGISRLSQLEELFPESKNLKDAAEMVEFNKSTLMASLYFVKGYNKTLELMADMFKVEELKLFKIGIDIINEQIEALNHLIYLLYAQIKDTDYEDKELQEKKLKVLKDYFQPIDLGKLEIPKEKIAKAKRDMKGFKAFTVDALDPYITLGIYDPNYIKDKPVDWEHLPIKKGGLHE